MGSKEKTILLFIILTGFALRVWGLGFGLPFQFHQDEPMMVNHALAYGTGDLNPHYFALPPFTSYLLFFVYGLLFLAGKIAGIWAGGREMAVYFFKDPTVFYLSGRMAAGVLPGTFNILLTYILARKVMGERPALFAAAVMAVSFLNVINSHYIYVDTLLVTGVLLTFIALGRMTGLPSLGNYLLCGICIGFSAGVKYNGVLLVVPFLAAHVLVSRGTGFKLTVLSGKAWAAAAAAVFTFIAANPYMLLSPGEFLGSIAVQSRAFWYTGWQHHFIYSLREGLSAPILLAGSAGLIILLMRTGWGRVAGSFWGIFYLVLVFRSQHFARYVLPLVPFVSMGAAYVLFGDTAQRYRIARSPGYAFLVCILFLPPVLFKSITADMLFSSTDTRVVSAGWIKDNLSPGSALACDSTNFRPALNQTYSQLEEKKKTIGNEGGLSGAKELKLSYMMEAAQEEGEGYPVYFMFEEPEKEGQFLATTPAVPYSIQGLKARGIRYVVINEQLEFPAKDDFVRALKAEATALKQFSPYKDGVVRHPYDTIATTCIPVTSRELYSRKTMGPAMTVYEIK